MKKEITESNAQRVANNTGYLFVRTFLVLLVMLYTSRVVLRTLGFEDFGLYHVVGSVVVFLNFFQGALSQTTYRYLAYELGTGDKARLQQVFSMAINSHFLLSITLFVILECGGTWFINNHLEIATDRINAANWAFQFSLFTFCINIIRTPFSSNIVAHERMSFYALLSIFEVSFNLGIVFLLEWSPLDKLISYSALLTIVSIIITFFYVAYCYFTFKECRYMRYWDKSLLKQFMTYSGWTMSVDVADVTTVQCMNIFFFNLLGAISNAALSIASQIINALNRFLHSFTSAFKPQIIKNYAAGRNEVFMNIIYTTSKISYFLLLLMIVPIVINIHFVLEIWLGDYPEEVPSFVQVIIIYILIDSFQLPLWTAVHATGDIRTHQILISIIKILAIPSIWLILYFGGTGTDALAAWAFLNLICAVVRILYMHHLISLDLVHYCRQVIFPLFFVSTISIPVSYAIASFFEQGFIRFIISTPFSLTLTSVSFYFMGLNKGERSILKTLPIIKKLINRR